MKAVFVHSRAVCDHGESLPRVASDAMEPKVNV